MATYYIDSAATGTGDGSSWTNAHVSMQAALDGHLVSGGDTFLFASTHAVTSYTANKNWSLPENASGTTPLYMLSVNKTSGNLEAGAIEQTTTGSIAIYGFVYMHGLTIQSGVSQSNAAYSLLFNNSGVDSYLVAENCKFILQTTGIGGSITIGYNASTQNKTILRNCEFGFSHAVQYIYTLGIVEMIGCSINASKTSPTSFMSISTGPANVKIQSCDFSLATNFCDISTDDTAQYILAVNTLLPTNITSGTHPGAGGNIIECHACGTATSDHNYQYYYKDALGTINYSASVYLTSGGATFNDTGGTSVPLSLSIVSGSYTSMANPIYSPWFNVEITSTGSKTFSIKIAHTLASVLKDIEAWIEVEYMGNAAHPKTTNTVSAPVVSGTDILDVLAAGSNLTDTAEAWTGITSEKTHTLSKTATVNQQGFARARVVLAKASTTIYVDPQVAVA